MIDVVTVLFCLVGLLGYVAFMAAWHVRSHGGWLHHRDPLAREVARMLMVTSAAWVFLLGMTIIYRLYGDWPARRIVLTVFFGLLMVKPWWWLRVVWHAQSRQQAVRKDQGE